MDVTDAVTQDQIADTLVAEPEVEATDTASTEEVAESEEQLTVEGEQQTEEDADWLPSEQEKVFPPEVIAKYAGRYGFTQEQLDANPSLLNLLHDKINTDIFVRQQQEQSQFEQEPEAETEQARPTPQPIPFHQWHQNALQVAKQINSPEMAQQFAKGFLGAFGVNDLPKDFNTQAFADHFTVYAMNLLNNLIPMYFQAPSQAEGKNMFQHFVEQNYDGLGDIAQSSAYRSAWNSVRQSSPELSKLAYGSEEFSQLMEKAEQALPGLQWMQFADKNGKALSPKANAERQYQIAARIAQGQRLSPELMKQAVQTGQRLARQSQVRKQAGNLGAGNSKQQFSQQSDDKFWSDPASWNDYVDRRL